MHKHIVFLKGASRGHEALLEERFADRVEIAEASRLDQVATSINALITMDSIPLPEGFIQKASNLEWIHVQTHGYDKILTPEFEKHQATLTNSRLLAEPVSDHAYAMLLALVRGLPEIIANQKKRVWQRTQPASLAGKTVCIVGTGTIGSAAARRAKAFGMRVIGVNRTPKPGESIDEAVGIEDLDAALSRSDVLIVILPKNEQTDGLLDAKRLALLRPGAYVINVGRGGTLDEAALASLLESGHIKGAGLDVFETEPLPQNSPLWDAPNLIVSPHVAGYDQTTRKPLIAFAADQIERYLNNEPLLNVVKPGKAI